MNTYLITYPTKLCSSFSANKLYSIVNVEAKTVNKFSNNLPRETNN